MATLVYIKKNKCKSDHGAWGLQKAYFQAYLIHCHGPKVFVVGKAKEVMSEMSGDHGREKSNIFHSYEERGEEEGEKVKHEENSKKCPFWHI